MQVSEKKNIIEFIKKLPDEVTIQEIQYHLYVIEKIKNAKKDIKEGNLLSQEEVENKINQWILK